MNGINNYRAEGLANGYDQHTDDQINENRPCYIRDSPLEDMPISALRSKSRDELSRGLNSIKVIFTENGCYRDFRGILVHIGLTKDYERIMSERNPVEEVLKLWEQQPKDFKYKATIDNLQKILETIDQWDVLDDTKEYFLEDAESYRRESTKKLETNENTNSQFQPEHDVLTRHDTQCQAERYDAYLLFHDDDTQFADEIIKEMEKRDIKLFYKDRDLLIGTEENNALMRIISERCHRLIVIFSKVFSKSPQNDFLLKYTQAVSIENGRRTIIPVIFESCELPTTLSLYYKLPYRHAPYFDFWTKLYESIRPTPNWQNNIQRIPPEVMVPEPEDRLVVPPVVQPAPSTSQFEIEPEPLKPKKRGMSDKENETSHSSLSLDNSNCSPKTGGNKKIHQRFKKFLSRNTKSKSREPIVDF